MTKIGPKWIASVLLIITLALAGTLAASHGAQEVVAWGDNTFGLTNVPSSMSNVVGLAAGDYHNLALTAEGQVVAWGDNTYGQAEVPGGLSNVVAIAAGATRSLALTSAGRVVEWPGHTNVPSGLTNAVAIAAGRDSNLALTAEGRVVQWPSPGNVPAGLSNVVAVAAGAEHSLALTADGRAVAWGSSQYGQTTVPPGLSNGVAVAAGVYQSLALTAEGRVVGWGSYLDLFSPDDAPVAVTMPGGLSNLVAIAAGYNSSLGLTADGRIVEWGISGTGLTEAPDDLSNVVAIAIGGGFNMIRQEHALALRGLPPGEAAPALIGPRFLTAVMDRPFFHRIMAKNGATAYGADGLPFGLVLDSHTGAISGQPTQVGTYEIVLSATNSLGSSSRRLTLFVNPPAAPVIASRGFVQAGLGISFSLTLVAYNAPESYAASGLPPGLVIDSQTGAISGVPIEVGDFLVSLAATNRSGAAKGSLSINVSSVLGDLSGRTSGLTNVVALATGQFSGLALTAEGRVVELGATNLPGGLSNIVAASVGGAHALALTAQGRVVAWGRNFAGQTAVPPDLSNVVAIAAGFAHSLALTAEGRVVAWGSNSNLDFESVGQSTVPRWLDSVVAIAAGQSHSLALTSEGRVVGWGDNGFGQTSVPIVLGNVVAIAAGGNDSLALTAGGRVVGWGATLVPEGLSDAVAIALGGGLLGIYGFTEGFALRADGRVVTWGWRALNYQRYPLSPLASNLSNVVAIASGGVLNAPPPFLALLGLPTGLAPPAWIGPQLLVGAAQRPFFHRIMVKNGADAYGASGLPAGLALDANTGLITGIPTQAGKFDLHLSATNRLGSCAWPVTLFVMAPTGPGIANSGVVQAGVGLGLRYAVTASNLPEWYGALGLPTGLVIDPQNGEISGVPIECGDSVVSLLASNRYGLGTGSVKLRVSPLVAWGMNSAGQTDLPSGLSNVVALAAGGAHSLALTAEGRVVGWGDNSSGQSEIPSALSNVVAVAAGSAHSLALTAGGLVVAWGNNQFGQAAVPGGLRNAVAITAGPFHSLALNSAGRVVGWGLNTAHQTDVPPGLGNVVAIAAGDRHGLALIGDGRLVSWGATDAPGGSHVVAIAAGNTDSLALTSEGKVVAWRYVGSSQTEGPDFLASAVAIAAGAVSLALTPDGRVIEWGLDVLPSSQAAAFRMPNGLSNVVTISAGATHCLALLHQPRVPTPGLKLAVETSGLQLHALGAPGISCQLLRASQLTGRWLPAQPVTFTNRVQLLRAPDPAEPAQFFRLLRK